LWHYILNVDTLAHTLIKITAGKQHMNAGTKTLPGEFNTNSPKDV